MSNNKKDKPNKVTSSSIASRKGKTGTMRKEKHLSAQNKRNQASKDSRDKGNKA